jgi:predicted component of type VI protein secretion system
MATMSTLRLVPPVGAPIDVQGDRALVGRDPSADIVVNDPSVSRRHAVVERRPEGWAVFDQRSANGTWVDNVRVEQALLQPGQQLRLGAVSFEVQVPGAAAPRAPGTIAPQPQVSPYGQPAYPPPVAPAYQPPPAPAYPPQPGAPPSYAPQAPVYQPPAAPAYAPPAAPPAYPPPPQAQPYPPQPSYPAAPSAPPGYPQTPAHVYAQPAGQPSGGGAPIPGAPRSPAPPPGAGGMTEAEAAEILGLWPGSPADEVKRRYQKLFNDFQIRITNAPTPALKKMYQKNIQDLRTAADIISPGVVV